MSILDKAKDVLAASYAQGQREAALPSGFIDILLDLGLSLFKTCMSRGTSPSGIKAAVRGRPLLTRLSVRRAVAEKLRNEHGIGGFRHFQGDRMVDALLDAAGGAGDTDLKEFGQLAVELE